MTIIDFLIGMTLMNSMPHFVLGTWKGRMLSAFGFGDLQNILYGLLNLILSVGLFLYKYGMEKLLDNGIFTGALVLLVIYFLTGQYWYTIFHKNYYENSTIKGTTK
ncbi:MAG: hypothetical protein C4557_00855 [Anaerolineaceae bacterium]|jgi:hypothetical protein|nr:MAG: hypothetical protein C4557_00855 [Anaerolineaceae bacterium]